MYLEYDKFWKRIIEANFLYKGFTAFTPMSNSAIKLDHTTEVLKADFQWEENFAPVAKENRPFVFTEKSNKILWFNLFPNKKAIPWSQPNDDFSMTFKSPDEIKY